MSDDELASLPRGLSEAGAIFSRRRLLGTTTLAVAGAALAAGQQARAQTPQSVMTGEHNASASNPGPENEALKALNPNSFMPPWTDHGLPPTFWSSFSLMHRRIQDGGWTRQVNVRDFPISTQIAGVNMRLTAGGIRELHWHKANEWALMLNGNCRLTALDFDGRPYVNDVAAGDLWYFPTGVPHSLQGLGPDGCEFLLVFDDGNFSEDDTTLLSDWMIHTPREVVAKNWGVAKEALDPFNSIPLEGRYIFQAPVPPPLEQDKQAVTRDGRPATTAFGFRMMQMKPQKSTKGGDVPHRRFHEFSGGGQHRHGARDAQAGRIARAALASECRRMAILYPRQRANDRVLQSLHLAHDRFPRRRRRLCSANARTLCREYRRHRSGLFGDVQGAALSGHFAQRLAQPPSARIGDRASGNFAANIGDDSACQLRGAAGVIVTIFRVGISSSLRANGPDPKWSAR